MEKKLKVANIGMKFGMSHVEGAISYGDEIAAICDCIEENLRFAGERYGIPEEKRFTDYMDIVNNKDIDVVTVAIPDQQHVKVSYRNAPKRISDKLCRLRISRLRVWSF